MAKSVEPSVFVIVLNWNLKDDLSECLTSLGKATYTNMQTVVVDNASDDGSVEMVQRQFPGVNLIVNEENLGFAAGNNRGLEYALANGAEHVLLLNNDTTIAPDMINLLVNAAQSEPALGILGPTILYHGTDDRVWYLGHKRSRWLPVPFQVTPHLWQHSASCAWSEVDYLSGCAMLIQRDVFERIGLLDDSSFMHYEDADFCWRAQQAGYRLACVPGARMWHKISRSSRREALTVHSAKARNRVLFYRRHPHGPHPWLTSLYLLISAGVVMARFLLRGDIKLMRAYAQSMYSALVLQLDDDGQTTS